jgi:hypothetical protein
MRFFIALVIWLFASGAMIWSVPASAGSSPVTFTPLHTYFMSPNGSDANSGTNAAHPWATPNHSVVCGDVIVAAAGDYSSTSFGSGSWGTVSNCPSTSGGIDRKGGIYFAVVLCGGTDLEACHSSGQLWDIPQSNWAIEGWKVSNPGGGFRRRAFNPHRCNAIIHHLAFINDIAFNSSSGFHTDDCGFQTQTAGVDYFAVVGSIAQNASQNASFCEAAIDHVGPGKFDSDSGTHSYIWGNFAWRNIQASCTSDSESIMLDTWGLRSYDVQAIIANNVSWQAMRYCVELTSITNNAATIKIYNNTCYSDLTNVGTDFADGEINLATGGTASSITIQNNIAQTTSATSAGNPVYAYVNGGGTNTNVTTGGTGNENIFNALATSCAGGSCDSRSAPFNATEFNGNSLGANIYTDPLFANTTDLNNNQSGAPNCSGFENVTQCMGWNAATSTLTTPSVISDLAPTCSQCGGKGYQKPIMTCLSSFPDFPVWLKGIVYLHWTGKGVQQMAGLVNRPCGM